MAITRAKFIAFALMAALLSMGGMSAALLGIDLYAHSRVERSVGVNRRGYRGPLVPAKQPGELRVVVLGGSTVFGYGVNWDETIPAYLEHALAERMPGHPVRVINLGFIGEGVYAFLPTLEDFASLDYDIACLYEGYNDLRGDAQPNVDLFRHESPIFRMTGYFPVLPLALREKAMSLRFGDVSAAYEAGRQGDEKPVFHVGLARRTSAAALETAAALSNAMARQLDRVSRKAVFNLAAGDGGCETPWTHYCNAVKSAVDYATANGRRVLVVAQPRLKNAASERHADEQRMLADLAKRSLVRNPLVRYLDLSGAIDLTNPELTFDGMHLNPAGNVIIADALVGSIQALAAGRQ